MIQANNGIRLLIGALLAVAIVKPPLATCRADEAAAAAKQRARDHWENVILFFGDEETGEWSLRIRDKDVADRAWFEYLELWQFDRAEKRWTQIKTDKMAKAIVLPKQKTSDQPEDSQSLVEFKEIEPRTAGLWYCKWRIDEVDCGTLMRVGTGRHTNHVDGNAPDGVLVMVVPVDLDKSEQMLVPDPRVYCVAGGTGKPDGKAPKKAAPKADADAKAP